MKIIPVLDLKDGVVVHAHKGQRESYLPVCSNLCPSSDIYQVIRAFLTVSAFDTFYIADLDAITGQGGHDDLITDVMGQFPQLMFWVDQGYRSSACINRLANGRAVLGSESYKADTVAELGAFKGNFILSLDYAGDAALGAHDLFNTTKYWPDDIIIMTLAKVGGIEGPDIEKLRHYCERYPHKNFIAAGGVRDKLDLVTLRHLGIRQVLMASALHSGKLNAEAIADLQAKKYPDERGIFNICGAN